MGYTRQSVFNIDTIVDDLISAVARQIITDINLITKRVARAQKPSDIFAWIDGDRLRHDDVRDVCISVAETASLVAFRRPGETWRLEVADDNSSAGSMINADLHTLRAGIIDHFRVVSRVHHQRVSSDVISASALSSRDLSHRVAPLNE